MKIKEAIQKGTIELKLKNIETPKLKTRLLMQYILNETRQYLIVHDNDELNQKQEEQYFKYIKKLSIGVPLQHITHQQEFMKMKFYVNENVLIPRPDTEILVEEVIKISKKNNAKEILDLCTGSGAIAISLAKYLPNVKITAVDISDEAIKVAKRNAKENDVENQITFIESNLFTNLEGQKYDIIVSNPPYIKRNIINKLDDEVKKEPIIALDGGIDGLDFYRKIINDGCNYIKYNGYLCLEIGFDQREDVIQLIDKEENYIETYSKKDLYDKDRIVVTKVGD